MNADRFSRALNDDYILLTLEQKFNCVDPEFKKADDNTITFTTSFVDNVEKLDLEFCSLMNFEEEDALSTIIEDLYEALEKTRHKFNMESIPKWVAYLNTKYPEEK